MEPKPRNTAEYLKTKVLTASPEQLQLLLYDGALRFGEQARQAIEEKNVEKSYQMILRVENIVMELHNSMRDDVAPDACANLRRLYMFCYGRLVTANVKKDLAALSEALGILRHIRETWILLMEKLRQERTQQAPLTVAAPDDPVSQHLGATISLQG